MKRINTITGLEFKYGDVREDGHVFWGYRNKIKKNGYFAEQWLNPIAFKKKSKNCNKARCARYANNPDPDRQRNRAWRANNPERNRELQRTWKAVNPDKNKVYCAKHRADKLQRTPEWLTEHQFAEIEEFYIIAKLFQMYTGETYHVDHIVPLRGKKVSGLHVPWNLQVLHWKDNLVKNNKHA